MNQGENIKRRSQVLKNKSKNIKRMREGRGTKSDQKGRRHLNPHGRRPGGAENDDNREGGRVDGEVGADTR